MNRARVDLPVDPLQILPIALSLARYLEILLSPRAPEAVPDQGRSAESKKSPPRAIPDAEASPLIGDAEYSVKQAMSLTHRPEVTIRKYIQNGKLPSRLDAEGRRLILGKDLAHLMTLRSHEPASESGDGALA